MSKQIGEALVYTVAAAILVGALYWLHLRLQANTADNPSSKSQVDELPGAADFYANYNTYNYGVNDHYSLGGALGGFTASQVAGQAGTQGQNNGDGGGTGTVPGNSQQSSGSSNTELGGGAGATHGGSYTPNVNKA